MCEIGDALDAEHQRRADAGEGEDGAGDQAVQQELEELLRHAVAPSSRPPPSRGGENRSHGTYGVNLMVFTTFALPSGMCCQMSYDAALMRPFSPKLIGPVAPLKCTFCPARIALMA